MAGRVRLGAWLVLLLIKSVIKSKSGVGASALGREISDRKFATVRFRFMPRNTLYVKLPVIRTNGNAS